MAEQILSPEAVYSATPTLRVNGQADANLTTQLLSMEMREQEGGMSSMELRFSNFGTYAGGVAGYVFEDGATLKLGAALEVYAGDVASPTEIFRGKITGLEGRFSSDGPPELMVLAEDALQAARMQRRTKTWDRATLASIISEIANRAGLKPVISNLNADIGDQQQLNESDLHFLRRLLARYDCDLQVSGTELHASSRSDAQRNAIEVILYRQLRKVSVLADLAHQATEVTATGWDCEAGQTYSVASNVMSLGPGSGRTGKQWLALALTQRSEHAARLSALNAAEAQAIVDAEYAQRARRFLVAHGTAEGNPSLRVGTWITLTGLGARFSNTYYATAATHRFDQENGYETDFIAECAYLAEAA
jgi:phage protein D